MSIQNIKNVYNKPTDEEILVVSRTALFPKDSFNGIKKVDFSQFEEVIRKHSTFIWRSSAEIDPNYKQIIPYLLFNYEDKYFLMQRRSDSSDTRLQNKYSLGIGGHIRKDDIDGKGIMDWARREFDEEILYSGNFEISSIGILNDDSNFVGQVHIGYVFLLKGDSGDIKIKSELKSGNLITLLECKQYYPNMESWSQYVYNFLRQ